MNKKMYLLAQVIFLICFFVLLLGIINGIIAHDILAEGSIMLTIYWGQFTFIDIYISFLVFFLWVAYREHSVSKSILWFVLIMCGGSMSICFYLFIAFKNCDNDIHKLLLGNNYLDEINTPCK